MDFLFKDLEEVAGDLSASFDQAVNEAETLCRLEIKDRHLEEFAGSMAVMLLGLFSVAAYGFPPSYTSSSAAAAVIETQLSPSSTQTVEALEARIHELQTKIAQIKLNANSLEAAQHPPQMENSLKKPGFVCRTFHDDLSLGAHGEDIAALNLMLGNGGIKTGTSSDSTFSEDTAARVVQFQREHGIRQTGVVGPATRAKLNEFAACVTERSHATSTPPGAFPDSVKKPEHPDGYLQPTSSSAVMVKLYAKPTVVVSEGSSGTVTLYWGSRNATVCHFEKAELPTSGSIKVSITKTATFTISCTGSSGSAVSNAVTVGFKHVDSTQSAPQ